MTRPRGTEFSTHTFPPSEMVDSNDLRKFISNTSISTAEFEFGSPKVRQYPTAEILFRRHLVLHNEDLPKGRGRIAAFYNMDITSGNDSFTTEERQRALREGDPNALYHLYVGRLVVDRRSGLQMCLTLRYTPTKGELLFYDFYSHPRMALQALVPTDHRTGRELTERGVYLVDFARSFGVRV